MEQYSAIKHAQITKLGTEIVAYGRTRGTVLKCKGDGTYVVSLSDSGVNWSDTIPIDKIELYTGKAYKPSTKHQVIIKEDEGCEGGACKI